MHKIQDAVVLLVNESMPLEVFLARGQTNSGIIDYLPEREKKSNIHHNVTFNYMQGVKFTTAELKNRVAVTQKA